MHVVPRCTCCPDGIHHRARLTKGLTKRDRSEGDEPADDQEKASVDGDDASDGPCRPCVPTQAAAGAPSVASVATPAAVAATKPAAAAAVFLVGKYACTECDSRFPSRNKLMGHLRAVHDHAAREDGPVESDAEKVARKKARKEAKAEQQGA